MGVKDAFEIACLDQFRELMLGRNFYLAHVLAQLRLDVVHTKRCIDISLVLTGHEISWIRLFAPKETIVIDGHIHAERSPTQRNMVLFRACEMVQGIGKLAIPHDTQVHIDAITENDAGFSWTLTGNGLDPWLTGENLHDVFTHFAVGVVGYADNGINIFNGFAFTSQ